MASLEKLYEVGEKLSKAAEQQAPQQKVEELTTEYKEILSGVRSTDPLARRLSSQFIARFFSHFPNSCDEALEAMLDLCEDNDVNIRKQAIKDLPHLCRDLKQYLPKIVDVLAQLFQSDDQSEHIVIQNSLMQLFRRNAKGTLIGLFSQIKSGSDVVRSRTIHFLNAKIQAEGSTLLNKEAEFTLMKEVKASLKDCSAEDFHRFMQMLRATSIQKTITGQTQMLEIASTMAELDKEFDASDPDAVDKLVQCFEEASSFFSAQVKSTKFCQYLCHQVLPRLHSVSDLDDQTKILKVLAESCMFTSDIEEPLQATKNIYKKLIDYMPLPPADAVHAAAAGNVPEFEFTKVECLLLAYHTIARQSPQHLAEDEERAKDFKARLQYFSRGVQAYIKRLKELLSNKTPAELKKEENKLKATALKCTTNIQTLIKDLFHTPPIFKAKVIISWKPELANKSTTIVSAIVEKTSAKRQQITFEDGDHMKRAKMDANGGSNKKPPSVRGGGIYKPPAGKYSTGVKKYPEGEGGFKGRGGRYGGRGRFYY